MAVGIGVEVGEGVGVPPQRLQSVLHEVAQYAALLHTELTHSEQAILGEVHTTGVGEGEPDGVGLEEPDGVGLAVGTGVGQAAQVVEHHPVGGQYWVQIDE